MYAVIVTGGKQYCVSEGDVIDKGDILFVVDENNTSLGYQINQDDNYIDPVTLIEING